MQLDICHPCYNHVVFAFLSKRPLSISVRNVGNGGQFAMSSVYLEAFQRHNVDASKFHCTIRVEWKDMSSTNKRKAATKKTKPTKTN